MPRIAVIQMDASVENLARAGAHVAEAARRGADFVVLPELSGCPWLPAQEEAALREVAESDNGPSVAGLREAARRHGVNLIAPLYEADGERRYSTAYVIGRAGQVIGKYRKNHIPYEPGWYEKFYYGPGDSGYPVFETEGLRFGIQICWDNMFPEGARILALRGAQVIFSPRATGLGSLQRWRSVLMANAAVNHLFVATANRVGEDRGVRFGGDALIIGPGADLVAETGNTDMPTIAVADLNLEAMAAARDAEPYFENRRPEIYRDILKR